MLLVVNLGLKSIRIIIFDNNGKEVYSASRLVHTYIYYSNVEQDVLEWETLLDELLFELLERTELITQITHITSTTSSSCIFGLSKDGKPQTKVLMVSDKRSTEQVKFIQSNSIYEKYRNKYNFKCSTSSTIPKILWLKQNKLDKYNKTDKWIGAGEYLGYFFCRKVFSDPLNASKAFYIESINKYPVELFENLDLKIDTFPKVKPIGSTHELDIHIKEKYGFNNECVYIQITYDAICAVIGSSNGLEGNACDVSGTITSVRMLVDIKNATEIKSDSLLKIQNINLIGKKSIGSSNNLGGGLIEWHKQAFYTENNNDDNVYFKMEDEALKSGVGANGIIFLPYLMGERAPFISEYIKGSFYGISRSSTREDFTRAVFESTAYITNDLLSLLSENKCSVKSLSVSGGLSRFDLINQIKADVTGLPVYVVEDFESTSLGAFILVKTALNEVENYNVASNHYVAIRKVINPNKRNHDIYKEFLKLFYKLRTVINTYSTQHLELYKLIENYTKEILRNL